MCQDCFISLEKYVELQQLAKKIEVQLVNLFQKTHSEVISIQEEIEKKETSQGIKFKCKNCEETFHSLSQMMNHEHREKSDLNTRRQYLKSRIEESKVSQNFLRSMKQQGVNYNFEIFQKTFFTENERDASTKPSRDRRKEKSEVPERFTESDASEDFKHLAGVQEIRCNSDKFQKSFSFSELELEAASKKIVKRDNPQMKLHSPEKYQSPKVRSRMVINEEFIQTLRSDGIEYNLAVFQKAFGCTETTHFEFQPQYNEDQSAKNIKSKGIFDCKQCGVRFTTRISFLRHSKVHVLKDQNLYCEACSKSFKTPACLQIHLATDHGRSDGPFDCPICFKSYQDRPALRSHFYIHSTERSFLCGR